MKVLEIYKQTLRNRNYSKRTIEVYSCYLEKFFIESNISDPYQISTNQIKEYLLKKTYSSISVQNQFIGALKLFAKYILKKKNIHLDKIERPRKEHKLPNVISNIQACNLINSPTNYKHKSMLYLLYTSGIRISELLNLIPSDIRSDRKEILVRGAKGNKDRITLLNTDSLDILRMYYKDFRPKVYLFEGKHGEKYSASSVRKIVDRAARKVNIIQKVNPHTLRHSFATHLIESGVNDSIVQRLLGHKSIKTTQIYNHVSNHHIALINFPLVNKIAS